jgi:hypothetical protein
MRSFDITTNPQQGYGDLADSTAPGKTIDQLSQGTFTKYFPFWDMAFKGWSNTWSHQQIDEVVLKVC